MRQITVGPEMGGGISLPTRSKRKGKERTDEEMGQEEISFTHMEGERGEVERGKKWWHRQRA